MTDTPAPSQEAPRRAVPWCMVLLVVSLAANLLVAGALAVRFFAPERYERFTGSGYSPLIPRRFFGDLSAERRKELGDLLRQNRTRFRGDFAEMRKVAGEIADALEKDPYDEVAVIDAIRHHAEIAGGMVQRGSDVTIEMVRKLRPEERALLAERIRERAASRRH
jgi:uncharacterized membrane protein